MATRLRLQAFRRRPRARRPIGPAPWADVLASLSDGIVVTDAEGFVAAVNPAAEQLLRTSASLLVGQTSDEAFTQRSDGGWLAALVRTTIAGREVHRASDGLVYTPDGPVAVRASCAPVYGVDGERHGAVLVLHDLGFERALEVAARQAERLEALAVVAAGLAHEIRNPLGGIRGAAQLLGAALHDPEHVECTTRIIREVDRLSGLVDQLRDVGGDRQLALGPVNIHRVVTDVIALLRQDPVWGATTLHTAFDPSLPPVLGDREQLTQVVLNLAKNALEALGGTGTLTIGTHVESAYRMQRDGGRQLFASLVVEDTGPGVPEADRARLFAPLFTTKAQGTGLGLALCHRIVSEHGGTITHEPLRTAGARFRVRLPLAPGPGDGDG